MSHTPYQNEPSRPTSPKKTSAWGRAWKKLTASQRDLVHDELAIDAKLAGAESLCDCSVRNRVVLQGQVAMVTINPRTSRNWLEVTLDDGTGTATLIWMGRRSIPGIEPGRRIRVEGRLADDHGRRVIYNPQYQLLS